MSSAPQSAPKPEHAARIPTFPVMVNELDKILIQDLLNERAKLRESIRDTIRVIGIALAAVLGFVLALPAGLNQQSRLPSTTNDYKLGNGWAIFVVVLLLIAGFGGRTQWLRRSLDSVTEILNNRLKAWGEKVTNDDILEVRKFWSLIDSAFYFLVAIGLAGAVYLIVSGVYGITHHSPK